MTQLWIGHPSYDGANRLHICDTPEQAIACLMARGAVLIEAREKIKEALATGERRCVGIYAGEWRPNLVEIRKI